MFHKLLMVLCHMKIWLLQPPWVSIYDVLYNDKYYAVSVICMTMGKVSAK